MALLLLGEHDNHNLNPLTSRTVSAAARIDPDIHLLIAGNNCADVARQGAKLDGVKSVLLAQDQALAHQMAEPMAALLVSLAPKFDNILAPSTTNGKNILPRVAALLDVMQVSDVVEVLGPDVFVRPIYAGNALQTVKSTDGKKIITVRTSAFDPVKEGNEAPVENVDMPDFTPVSSFVSHAGGDGGTLDLTSADRVISGGRALGSKQAFDDLIGPVAAVLGAATGASRAAVDAGYAPNDWQVGQTGKIVAPGLYIAVGISGAIQHLAGMIGSKTIVAINNDPEAPIFEVADYCLVADLFEALPELLTALEKLDIKKA